MVIVIAQDNRMGIRLTTRWDDTYPFLLGKGINYVYHTGGEKIQPMRDTDRFITGDNRDDLQIVEDSFELDFTGHSGVVILMDAAENDSPNEFARDCFRQASEFILLTGNPAHEAPTFWHEVLFRIVYDDHVVTHGPGSAYLIDSAGTIVYNADELIRLVLTR